MQYFIEAMKFFHQNHLKTKHFVAMNKSIKKKSYKVQKLSEMNGKFARNSQFLECKP